MPPFALRLLHSEVAAVELEDTTAILVLRLHLRCERLSDGSKVREYQLDASGGMRSQASFRSKRSGRSLTVSSREQRQTESSQESGARPPKMGTRQRSEQDAAGYNDVLPSDYDSDASTDTGAGGVSSVHGSVSKEQRQQRAADYDTLMAKANLAAVLAVERVLKSDKFASQVTCVNIVGNDIVIAVHGNSSSVFGLGKVAGNGAEDDGTEGVQSEQGSSSGRT